MALLTCSGLCGIALLSAPARATADEILSASDRELLEELELLQDWELLVNWDPTEDLPIPIEGDPNGIGGERGGK